MSICLDHYCGHRTKGDRVYRVRFYKGFDFVFLVSGKCRGCGRRAYGYFGESLINGEFRRFPASPEVYNIEKRGTKDWESLIRQGKAELVEGQALYKEARSGIPIGVSEATVNMAKDPAKRFTTATIR